LVGGEVSKKTQDIAYEYNIATNDIVYKNKMNEKRQNFGILFNSSSQTIYVFGGFKSGLVMGDLLNKCEMYSIVEDAWIEISPMKFKT